MTTGVVIKIRRVISPILKLKSCFASKKISSPEIEAIITLVNFKLKRDLPKNLKVKTSRYWVSGCLQSLPSNDKTKTGKKRPFSSLKVSEINEAL